MRDEITVPIALFKRIVLCLGVNALPGSNSEKAMKDAQPFIELCGIPRLEIFGREWWSRSSGTTYYAYTIYANGEPLHKSGMESGYGDQYLYEALKWLKANCPDWVKGYDNGSATAYLREIQAEYHMTEVKREKELK